MLCQQVDVVPEGLEWILEPKFDGWRIIAEFGERTRLLGGRNGTDYSGQLPYLDAALASLPPDTAVDGELISERGFSDVGSIMRSSRAHRPSAGSSALTFVVFDVLRLAGQDVRSRPWHERRALLEALTFGSGVTVSPSGPATAAAHERLLALGMEGSVCKRRESRYVGAKSPAWVKVKPQTSDEATVVGFKPGTVGGSFDGMVGAFEVEMLGTGVATTVKCGTVARHQEATDHPERWLGVVIELAHHGIDAKSGVPRHPQFLRRRDDRVAAATPAPREASIKGGSTVRMRNYGAMKDPKLLACIDQLREGGDARDRVEAQGGDVVENIEAAEAVARDRKLVV